MNLIKKVSIILLCIMMFSFCVPGIVRAESDDDGIGGKLLDPVMSLVVSIGDGAMTLLQGVVFHIEDSLINVDSGSSFWSKFIVVAAAVIVAGVAIACIFIPGLQGAAAITLGVLKSVLIVTAVGTTTAMTFSLTTSILDGMLPGNFQLPLFSISPKEIFSNELAVLDVDFFNPMEDQEIPKDDGSKEYIKSTASTLQTTISKWYNILRDIAIVASLSILVYIGIRILLSSTSNDKAKYKQMIMDWVIALCLLFVMQYIMSFSNIIVDKVIDIVKSMQTSDLSEVQNAASDGKISNSEAEELQSTSYELFKIEEKEKVEKAYKALITDSESKGVNKEDNPYYAYFVTSTGAQASSASDAAVLLWPADNVISQARIKLQLLNDGNQTWVSIGWKLIYVVLVVYTFIFLFTYIKRVLYMAFLTIIAPLVAMTYPIDKINDGKAQAFDSWLKEYIFNLLIQPMHLIIYTILIGSAMDLAANNVIYVVCALGFMVPAEKLMRKFFGFEKAQTPGMLNGAAGAAIVMSGMQKLFSKGPRDGKEHLGNGGGSNSDKENTKINTAKDKYDSGNPFAEGLDTAEDDEKFGIDNDKTEKQDDNTPQMSNGRKEENNGPKNRNEDPVPGYKLSESGLYVSDSEDYKKSNALDIEDDKYNNYKAPTPNDKTERQRAIESERARLNARGPLKANPGRRSEKGGIIKGVKKAGGYWATKKAEKISNKIKNGHWGRKAIRMAGGAFLGATAATVGLASGIASGDASKAAQYVVAGGAGGYKLGSKVTNKATQLIGEEGTAKKFKEGYYGKDKLEEIKKQEALKETKRDPDLRFALEDKLGSGKAAREFLNNGALEDYYDSGIDLKDIDDIVTMAQMEDDGIERDKVIGAKLYKDQLIGDKDSRYIGAKAEKENNNTIMRDAEKRGYGKEAQERYAENINDHIRIFDDYKYGRKDAINEDYGKMHSHERIWNLQRDNNLREDLEREIGKEKTKSFMKDGIREYEANGIDITKSDDLVAMAKMEKSGMKRNTVMGIRKDKDRLVGDADSRKLGVTQNKAKDDFLMREAQDKGYRSNDERQKYRDQINKGINLYDDFKYGRRK